MKTRIELLRDAVEAQRRMIEAVVKSAEELEREREEERLKAAREASVQGR